MNAGKKILFGLFALFVFFPLTFAQSSTARAQQYSSSFTAPKISGFDVEQVRQLVAGTELNFTLYGTPGGIAIVSIPGGTGRLLMEEVETGLYVGSYTIKTKDRIAADSRVTANLRLGDRRSSAVLGKSLLATSGAQPSARRVARSCANCRVVEAINVIEVKGEGNYLGMIAAAAADLASEQRTGQTAGKTIATVAGAAGGAYAGREIENRMKTTKHYEVIARLESGGTQAVSYESESGFRVGDRVKVENGTLVRDQ